MEAKKAVEAAKKGGVAKTVQDDAQVRSMNCFPLQQTLTQWLVLTDYPRIVIQTLGT